MSERAAYPFGRVAVVMGGITERDVSLISGRKVFNSLIKQGIDAVALEVEDDLITPFVNQSYDRVFNVLHGGAGESGEIQSILTNLKLPYTDSSPQASTLAINKYLSKQLWQLNGLPVAKARLIEPDTEWQTVVAALGEKVVLKPVLEGSTNGISVAKDFASFEDSKRLAFTYGEVVMAESFIAGVDVTIGLLQQQPLPIVKVVPPSGFYDYDAKYVSDQTQYLLGRDACSFAIEQKAQALAIRAFNVLGCEKWGRVDFMLDGNDDLWLLEVNTVPGMTPHSLVPMAAKAMGIDFDRLVVTLLQGAS